MADGRRGKLNGLNARFVVDTVFNRGLVCPCKQMEDEMTKPMTKTAINEAMKPLSHGLLKLGKVRNFASIAGWPVEATRMYNSPGSTGPAWSPYYRVGESNNGVTGTAGPRDHCVAWLHKHQRVDA
jgi:hypothetical protein